MKILLCSFTICITFLVSPNNSHTNYTNSFSLFSKNEFFVKTRSQLSVSEATGKVSLNTGIKSLDEKIMKYEVSGIEKVFKLNNGDAEIYEKYGMSKIYIFQLDASSGQDIETIVKDFSGDEEVEFSEPNFVGTSAGVRELELKKLFAKSIPDDEMFYKQWYLQNNGSVNPSGGGMAKVGADINILEAWQLSLGSEDVIVAILDSGIKDDHPDLKDRMWINKEEVPNNGVDDDSNGYIDDYKGWDFAYDDRRPDDGFGHGTNIATVIGASTENEIGFAGIDKRCRLMNCKNLNSDNSGEYSWWAESIKYAVDNGAQIINMSEGGDDYSRVLMTAIDYAVESGAFVVAAMMNKGDNRDYYPASYKGVFAVGATDTDDNRCKKFSWGGGSCWGKHISVVAPGNKIYGLDYESDESYEVYWSGTSQSTAIVSGIASLLLAQDKMRTNEDLKRIIKLSSKDLTGDPREDKPGWDQFYGYGRVDSYSALTFESNNATNKGDDIRNNTYPDEKNQEPIEDVENSSGDKPARAVDKDNEYINDEDEVKPARKR